MFYPSFSMFALFLYFGLTCCFARDTITFDNPINSSGGPLISASEKFALGFFTPNGSSHGERYVGIWYYGLEPRTIVWVANREESVSNSTTWFFGIGNDSNLMLSDRRSRRKMLTTLKGISAPSTMTLKLLDSGNLILIEGQDNGSTRVVWQSFLHPTDTFLPGMKISETLRLTSWKSQHDPSPGRFVFRQDVERENQYIITNNEMSYWKSGLSGNFITNDEIRPSVSLMLLNISNSERGREEYCSILKYRSGCNNTLTKSYDYSNTRLVMGFDGKLRLFGGDNQTDLKWLEPRDRCSVFDACGKFGSCNKENRVPCKCLPGFKPQSPENWNNGDFSEGCTRNSPVCSQHGKDETFLKLSMMKVQKPNPVFAVNDKDECKRRCLETCACQAYSFGEVENYLRSRASNLTCGIWMEDLNNIQESYTNRGLDLFLRVQLSEIGNRTCETCGINIIPYPLSTGSSCGDPMYFSFNCQTDTGQISFNASGRTYRVTSIYPDRQRFSIQLEDAKKCRVRDSLEKLLQFPGTSPFFVSSTCIPTRNSFSTDSLSEDKWFYEVEIGWNLPLEPTCGSSEDCKDWPNSFCNVAADGKNRCICNSSFQWDPSKISCTSESYSNQRQGPLEKQKPLSLIFLGVTAVMLFILCTAFALYHKRRRRMVRRQGNWELSLYNSERRVLDFINSGDFREDNKKDIDVPNFDLESILVATDNFAEANKLGQGGFGPVYKGKLRGGQEIAIKRLSRGSGQGLEEFKNEVVLIAKLQHRNLVRLLGYCVKGYEKMLIYEYMPHKSLDTFIFDRTRCVLLNWEKRFDIILGIARGMLYLHQDSRLRIVHRDLKASNILLDEEMNPKISDFGLAKIFEGKQIEASTDRVVGTYGYMSPEYALDGFFSIKSDVFSFGVVLLETVSGKRNTGFYQAEQPLSLLGYAWRLWEDGRALDLLEQALRQTCNTDEFLRCVNVGLLCVQEDPSDRPTISNVLVMLGSETLSLPIPKQPAYVVRRSLFSSASSSSKQQWDPEIMTTLEEGR
ncbi:G-type lectin S-receptor-like serine/threonine-protein kinase At4g03230 [Durio zibethinus]|uniref:non-specific serine/threonine protein kinase n=1 Tax=Durio zibethinus TaxID=66656 RepID=A0A6P5XGM4_DURZI|nr:G-type lectin S-receptor-like serine/threonine-protein kinase At4g03230 [Durio zibethinus]